MGRSEQIYKMQDKIMAFSYHLLKNLIQNRLDQFLKRAKNDEHDKNPIDIILQFIPLSRIAVMIIFGIGAYFIPIPNLNSHRSIDLTLWIGALSLQGTLGIALIAVIPWAVSTILKWISNIYSRAIEHGFWKWDRPSDEHRSPIEIIENEFKHNPWLNDVVGRQYIRDGFILIIFAVGTIPLGLWLPIHLAASILVAYTVGTISILNSFSFTLAVSSMEIVWDMYSFLKKNHDHLKGGCYKCNIENQKYDSNAMSQNSF